MTNPQIPTLDQIPDAARAELARFIQGRLLMHGAAGDTPITAIENASRPEQRVLVSSLETLPTDLNEAGMTGPVLIFTGLSPYRATPAPKRKEAET